MRLLRVSLGVNVWIVILFILGMPNLLSKQDAQFNVLYSVLIIVGILLYLIATSKAFKSFLKYDLFFLLGFTIVHFQIPILYSIGIRNKIIEFAVLNSEMMNYLTWFSGVVILLWMIGSQITSLILLRKNSINRTNFNKVQMRKYIPDLVLLILFLGFLGSAGKAFLSGVYNGGQNWGPSAAYFNMLFRALLIVRIFYFFYSSNYITSFQGLILKLFQNKILFSVTITYILLFFFVGQRSTILELAILIVCCYNRFIRKLSPSFIVFGVIVGGLFFTLLGMGRTDDAYGVKGSILERGLTKYNTETEFGLPTDELAGSNKISYLAFKFFPSEIDYLNGKTLLVDAIGVIPFGSGLILGTDVSALDNTSTLLFTYLDQGKYSTFGAGSDILSDVYINFGVFGTIFLFFVFGCFIAFTQYKFTFDSNFYWGIVASIFLLSALSVNRSQLLSPLKEVFYALIFVKLFFKELK